MTDWVAQLCAHLGVHTRYRGADGQCVSVSRDVQIGVLAAMGFAVGSDAEARDHLTGLQAEAAARPLPPEVIVQRDQSAALRLSHPAEWVLEAETSGATLASGQGQRSLDLPPLPMGIHRLRLSTGRDAFTSWVLARPAKAVQLEDLVPEARVWGVMAALYGLTDGNAAAIGTYGLLGDYATALARHGADFIGLNPVHAMEQPGPEGQVSLISPYSPSHRAFLNTWHCAAPGGAVRARAALLDYPQALKGHAAALRDQFAAFAALPADAPEQRAFARFTADAGAALHGFALFEALATRFGPDWRDWPGRYQHHDRAALGAFEADHAEEITRSKWAQWQAERQLTQARHKARDGGMRIGLYLDLAVGARQGGAETWAEGSSLVTGACLGVPPDPLTPQGQNWGLAPLSPIKSRAEGFAGFANLLRASMRHAGMIRIDHMLGLMRSFWIPGGAAAGTFVSYPFDALLAVVAIESHRSGTIVVGEDLGMIPEGLQDKLARSGIYGLDVLQYMRKAEGGFAEPDEVRQQAVCSFANHDTATITGFFEAADVKARLETGQIGTGMLKTAQADRARARATLETDDPVREMHRHLARSAADMVAVQLEDVAGQVMQQNLPGTVDTYPNWQLKAPFTIGQIRASSPFDDLGRDMGSQGRGNRGAQNRRERHSAPEGKDS